MQDSRVKASKRTLAYRTSDAKGMPAYAKKAMIGRAINRRASELLQKYGWSNYNRIGRARTNMLNALEKGNSNG